MLKKLLKSLKMLTKTTYIFCLLFFLFSTTGCKNITSSHNHGQQRIISLSPSLTQMVFKLDSGKKLVGVTRYDYFPSEVKKIPKVGGFLDVDPERLLSFKPDLVLLTEMHLDLKRKLDKYNIESLVLKTRSIEEVYKSLKQLGKKLNKSTLAKKLIVSLKKNLKPKSCKSKPRVLITLGHADNSLKNIVAAGPGTYLDQLLKLAGGKNAVNKGPASYPNLGLESIVQLSPDIILDIVKTGNEKKDVWTKVPFKNEPKIFPLSSPHISSPGVKMPEVLNLFHNKICK
ncbi:MAG: helical backbone metal receptor [Deltaproteobacteria bacterium]|jgi:iron complex transport system substrate-binding protein|nr:helical backbone metal receptor [Deltaproteobacteria bacterium]